MKKLLRRSTFSLVTIYMLIPAMILPVVHGWHMQSDGTVAGAHPLPHDRIEHTTTEVRGSHEDWAGFLHLQMTTLMANQNLPNAVAALVSSDEIHLLAGYGLASMDTGKEVDPSRHLFRTGSVAKIFTWTALMQLYEQGHFDMDDDIANHLPADLSYPVRFRGDVEPITFRHLMTHTAGFEDILEDLFTFEPQAPLGEYLRRHRPARIFPPGTVMAYSNYGTGLAGYIVERIAEMPFETYVKEHIFKPLGMDSSTMEQPPPGELADRLVTPYRWVDGRFLPGRFEHMPSPAGGLSTTASDMARFLQANLRGSALAGNRPANENRVHNGDTGDDARKRLFLGDETLALMHTPLFTHHPLLGGMAYGYKEFQVNGYQIVFHGGSSSVFDAGFYLIPELDLGMFIAYSGGSYSGHRQVLRALLENLIPSGDEEAGLQELRNTIPSLPVAPAISDLTGEYFQSRTIATGSDRLLNLIMGTLFVMPTDERSFSATILGEDFVFEELVPGIYRNTRDTGIYPFGPLRFLVAGRAPDGRLMLATDGPMTYIRAPWYGGSAMALVIFAPMLLLAAGTLLLLFASFMVRKISGRPDGGGAGADTGPENDAGMDGEGDPAVRASAAAEGMLSGHRLLAGNALLITHAAVLLVTIFLVILYGQPHPVHLLPESAFTGRTWMETVLDQLPFVITLLGLGVAWAAIHSWIKSSRRLAARIFYSIYAVWTLGLIWFFYYYGMLGL
jgi:CubicO group peptidase (beta-lactamase class C family)